MKEENSLINDESLKALNNLMDIIYSNTSNDDIISRESDENIKIKYLELLRESGKFTDEEIKELIKKIPSRFNRKENQKNVEELAKHAKSLNDGEIVINDIKGEKDAR